MTTETNGMEKFNQAIDLLARNGSIQTIETDGPGEINSEGEITSLSCRVHVRGIYREDEVQDWLTMKDPDLGVKTVPSDEFEEWGEWYGHVRDYLRH